MKLYRPLPTSIPTLSNSTFPRNILHFEGWTKAKIRTKKAKDQWLIRLDKNDLPLDESILPHPSTVTKLANALKGFDHPRFLVLENVEAIFNQDEERIVT